MILRLVTPGGDVREFIRASRVWTLSKMEFEKSLSSSVRKFDCSEFQVWSTVMEAVLTAKNLWYVIVDEAPQGDKAVEFIARKLRDVGASLDDETFPARLSLGSQATGVRYGPNSLQHPDQHTGQ